MRHTFRFFAAAALAAAVAGPLAAQTIITRNSDTEGAAWQAANGFTKLFGANVRAGLSGAGDWEFALVGPTDAPLNPPGQLEWGTVGPSHRYTLSVFSVGGVGLTDFLVADGIDAADIDGIDGVNTLIVRARTSGNGVATLNPFSILLDVGGSIDITDALIGDTDGEWIIIRDARLAGGFLIDDALAAFDPAGTTRSNTMYQFKIGTSVVPEPSTYALLATGLAGLGALARRRRSAAA